MNYNTAFCLVCGVMIVQTGGYSVSPPIVTHYLGRQVHMGPADGEGSEARGPGPRVFSQLGYTSTPLMREPSKTMVKS